MGSQRLLKGIFTGFRVSAVYLGPKALALSFGVWHGELSTRIFALKAEGRDL